MTTTDCLLRSQAWTHFSRIPEPSGSPPELSGSCVGSHIWLFLLCTFFSDLQLYHSETLELMLQRWSKLERDFRQKSGRYDISKIPDIYDCVKYDVQHNGSLGLQGTAELLRLSKALADVVIPQVCLI